MVPSGVIIAGLGAYNPLASAVVGGGVSAAIYGISCMLGCDDLESPGTPSPRNNYCDETPFFLGEPLIPCNPEPKLLRQCADGKFLGHT